MKLFRVLVLGVALAAGGIAAYLALNMGSQSPETVVELAPPIQSQDVLVAAADIGQGQKLTAQNVRWQGWPDDALNAAYIQKQARPEAITELGGSVVRSQFTAGEPIRDAKLANPESGFLSAILPAGKRAIAVRVSAQNTAGGFILPNDRVDVIQTMTQQGVGDAQPQTESRTILSNVKVLAIDQTVDEQVSPASPEGESGGGSAEAVVVGKTATLELDPQQVELITAAETSGTLSLSLRSFADLNEVATATPDYLAELNAEREKIRRLEEELRRKPKPVAAPEAAESEERKSSIVRIFRPGSVDEGNEDDTSDKVDAGEAGATGDKNDLPAAPTGSE